MRDGTERQQPLPADAAADLDADAEHLRIEPATTALRALGEREDGALDGARGATSASRRAAMMRDQEEYRRPG